MPASISFVPLYRRAAGLLFLLFVATATYAQITPSDDSYVNAAAPTANYGTAGTLDLSSAADTTFIRFDLTAVPASYTGAAIAKATLKLYVNTVTTAGSFNVDLVNGTWTEKTLKYSNEPAFGTTIAASVPLTTASKGTYVEIDITPALVEWLNGTQPNDGIALVANSPLVATFDSKENTAASHAAEIDIVYASGGTITGVTTASGSGLIGGGTSGTLNLSLTNACAANQVLQWNGTAWVCAAVGRGTVTGVTAGTDLTGGGTSGNVTLNLDITQVPQLNYTNTFTGNQTVNGNLSATGLVTGAGFNIGSNLFDFGSYANDNAFMGFAGNTTMTGIANTASGYQALLANTTGKGNVAYGTQALAANSTGNGNIALGAHALFANTTGSTNTATGGWALYDATTASDNTADGNSALYSTTTGYNNTASGYQALYANTTGLSNTATGEDALLNATTADNNTADGSGALSGTTTGNGNTASGYAALEYNTTGQLNTALGFGAGPDSGSPDLVFATAIGANAVVSESNALVLGGTGSNAVSVGIGTATPAYTLDVHGTGNFTGVVKFASGQQFPGSGTVTSVASGAGLTGGPITTTGTLSIVTGGVSNTMLANPSLTISPGTALTGGGSVALGGSTTLNLDTTKVPQLTSANTFTGAQTINNNVTITAAGTALTVSSNTNTGVSGSGYIYGVSGAGRFGVYGATSTNSYSGVVGGDTSPGGGYGVAGSSTSGTGVYGTTASTSGYGVYGTNSSNNSGGVYGTGYTGVFGASSDTNGVGVGGESLAATNGYGVYGYASTGANNYAGFFEGNVAVAGTLTSTVKDFRIDHPLDPANKYLYHASVESSEMMNIYTGNVTTDAKGDATVRLPDWFEALNIDFRYQLTVIGQFAQAIVSSEISNHRFGIKTDKPNVKVSWQVTGVRRDAYAKAHPLIPEVAKTGDERGKYVHPIEHGMPEAMGIDARRRAKMNRPQPPEPAQHEAVLKAAEQPPVLAEPLAPPKLAPPKLPQQPPVPAPPRTKPPVPQQHVAVPEPPK